jgi:hypothetical protein
MDITLKRKFNSRAQFPFFFQANRPLGSNGKMGLLTDEMIERLRKTPRDDSSVWEVFPVVRLHTPDGKRSWLLSGMHPEDETCFLALCDDAEDNPEAGPTVEYLNIDGLELEIGDLGMPVLVDPNFVATKTLWEYFEAANDAGKIVL